MSLKKFFFILFLFVSGVWAIDICAQTPMLNTCKPSNTYKPSSYVDFGLWELEETSLGLYGLSSFRDAHLGGIVGRFFGPFYIEGYMYGGLTKSETVTIRYADTSTDTESDYIYDDVYQESYTDVVSAYKSFDLGCNMGLGLQLDDYYWRLLPYVGIGFNLIYGTDADRSDLSFVMNAGVRTSWCLTEVFEIFITPEYRFSIGESSDMILYNSLTDASKTISNWRNGFRLHFGFAFRIW